MILRLRNTSRQHIIFLSLLNLLINNDFLVSFVFLYKPKFILLTYNYTHKALIKEREYIF